MAKYWVQYVFVGEIEAGSDQEARNKVDAEAKDAPLTKFAQDHGFRLYKSVLTKEDPVKQEKIIEGAKARLGMHSSRYC